MTLREVLHAHLPLLTPESTVRDAVDKMDLYQFPALVVVDPERRPLAVVTEGDLCRAASGGENLIEIAEQPAMRYGSLEPTALGVDAEIGDAFHKMLSSGLTLLPVLEAGTLAGVVMRCDLMQAILMDARREPPTE